MSTPLTTQQAVDLYTTMRKIRRFEETVKAHIGKEIVGPAHLYIGEEAVATGVCSNLTHHDYVTSTHRGHGHTLAKGARVDRSLAELYGRATGYCKGKGGSMHLADFSVGMLGANGVVGGAAIAGAKPVIDLHFADFIGIAMDEVLNQMAKAHYMFGGQATMSLVLRAPDGLMKHGAAQHSQSLETWFTNIPGIRVVVPSTPANGKQLLKAAIKDPNPVIYFENKGLFPVKGDVPEDLPPIDLSRAEVVCEGADVTLVSYGLMLTKALAAADVARREYGVSVEVIDLRSITPLDMPTIYASVKKTGHLVIAHEAIKIGGVGGEIAARVAENHFDYLRGPVLRVGARFTPLPFSPVMEDFVLSGEKEILDAVLAAAGKSAVDGADGAAGRAGEAA